MWHCPGTLTRRTCPYAAPSTDTGTGPPVPVPTFGPQVPGRQVGFTTGLRLRNLTVGGRGFTFKASSGGAWTGGDEESGVGGRSAAGVGKDESRGPTRAPQGGDTRTVWEVLTLGSIVTEVGSPSSGTWDGPRDPTPRHRPHPHHTGLSDGSTSPEGNVPVRTSTG